MNKYLIVDGMLSGTGIRNEQEGGYIEPDSLGISAILVKRLQNWLERYAEEHFKGYTNKDLITELDREGIEISKAIANELTDSKINYYSDANLIKYLI